MRNSVREGNLIKCLERKTDVTTVAKGNDPHYTIQDLFSLNFQLSSMMCMVISTVA